MLIANNLQSEALLKKLCNSDHMTLAALEVLQALCSLSRESE